MAERKELKKRGGGKVVKAGRYWEVAKLIPELHCKGWTEH